MGAVFDGQTKVQRAVKDPGTDKYLPMPIFLNLSSIAESTAVTPADGADVMVVMGDSAQWVMGGNVTEMVIGGDVTSFISGDETQMVAQNSTTTIGVNAMVTIGANLTWTIGGSYMALHGGPMTEILGAPLTQLLSAPECKTEPTPKMHILGVEFEKKDSEFTYCTNSFDINLMANEVNLVFKNEFTTMNNEVKVIDYATVLGVSIEPKVSEVELEPLHTFLKGGHAEATAGKVTAAPGVNAVPGAPTLHQ